MRSIYGAHQVYIKIFFPFSRGNFQKGFCTAPNSRIVHQNIDFLCFLQGIGNYVIDCLFIDGEINVESDAVVTGARQYAALEGAEEALEASLCDLKDGLPLDLCCVGIEQALTSLGELDGRELGEEIVGEIFSKFCVGK